MNYTFKIFATGIIDEFVDPVNSEQIDIIPYNTEGQKFIRNKLNSNIILSGNDWYIYNIIKANPCTQFSFIITRLCDNSELYKGLFTYYNIGNIDEDYCTFDFSMITDDIYTRFMNVWKDEYNILNTNLSYSPNELINEALTANMDVIYETEEYTYKIGMIMSHLDSHFVNTPVVCPNVWSESDIADFFPLIDDYSFSEVDCERFAVADYPIAGIPTLDLAHGAAINSYFVFTLTKRREILNIPQVNGTWIVPPTVTPAWTYRNDVIISGNTNKHYSRPYTYVTSNEIICTPTPPNYYYHTIRRYITSTVDFTNCRRLRSVINYMLSEMGFTYGHTSSFFYDAINPITNETQKLKYLLIGQKSDFINPIGTNAATIGKWSMERCCNYLRDKYNVYWFFDGNKLRFENEYYFFNGLSYTVLNELLLSVDSQYLQESNKYEINFSKYFGYEKFENSEQDGVDFIGVPIKYGSCLPDKNSEYTRIVSDVTEDIAFVYYSGQVSENDFVVLQTVPYFITGVGYRYQIKNENGFIAPSKIYTNGHLAWAMLQERYWKKGVRLMPNFNMNGFDVNQSLINGVSEKVKIQEEISFPFCCQDLNFYYLLKINDNPSAKMIDAKFNLNNEMLTVKLAYDI